MALAQCTFTSSVRRGFQPKLDAKAEITVTVAGQPPYDRRVDMLCAGDVTGIAGRQVIRSWPADGSVNVEPNYLALVEYDSPDIPWLFSRPPGPGGRVQPWICLAVVDETDIDDPLSNSPLGTQISVHVDQLPDPAEAWLWAHGQLLGADTNPGDPARSLARLICPRRLVANRRYLAVVLPTLKSTRIAALGGDPGDQRTSAEPAWNSDQGVVTLPVFHWFRFTTGPSGDFEALVRRLKGVPLPEGMGRRRLRLSHPLSGLPEPQPRGADLKLHVALRPPGETLGPIVPLVGQSYLDVLKSRLADAGYDVSLLTQTPGQQPHVGPPVYGQLPVGAAATAAALDTGAVPPWLTQLNLDPRLRVAAGLGAQVVRNDQDHYLETAWKQVGDVLAANRLRRRGEYSMATLRRLHTRWITKIDAGALLTATAPVHAKIKVNPTQTLVGRLRDSPLPPAVVSVELRRFARDRGVTVSAGWRADANVGSLLAHSAEKTPLLQFCPLDTIDTVLAPSHLWGNERAAEILNALVPGVQTPDRATAATRLDAITRAAHSDIPIPALVVDRLDHARASADQLLSRTGFLPAAVVNELAQRAPQRPPVRPARRLPGEVRFQRFNAGIEQGHIDFAREVLRNDAGAVQRDGPRVRIDAAAISAAARSGLAARTINTAAFRELLAGRPVTQAVRESDFALDAAQQQRVVTQFRDGAIDLASKQIRGDAMPTRPGRQLVGGLAGLRAPVVAALDPHNTLTRAVNSRIAALVADEATKFDDIMAAPDLSGPTYSALAKISHDWLLPGIDNMPTDTTTLVVANREFIAGFLVGMNHELARELLWHEYPTDQRGTYARQFWSRKATDDRADSYDLRHALHQAPDLNLRRLTGDGDDPLVLVVKGELVRRYPGVLICAAHTKAGPRGDRLLDTDREMLEPDFVGLLEPDVLLVGFEPLTERRVHDVEHDADNAYWFFFAEHFAESRFGFDELVQNHVELGPDEHRAWTDPNRTWNEAAWQYAILDERAGAPDPVPRFLTAASFNESLRKGRQNGDATRHRWADNAAAQAWIALQFPFRRGVPATHLLPPPRPGPP